MSIRHKKLPIEALERIDERGAAFERLWQSAERPAIEAFLETSNAGEDANASASRDEQAVLLAELVVLDVDYHRRRGEAPNIQEYLDRFPTRHEVIQAALAADKPHTGAFEPPTIARLAALFPSLEIVDVLGVGCCPSKRIQTCGHCFKRQRNYREQTFCIVSTIQVTPTSIQRPIFGDMSSMRCERWRCCFGADRVGFPGPY